MLARVIVGPVGSGPAETAVDPAIQQSVERARNGDSSAFDAIVLEYGTPLVRFLCGVLAGDVHAAHDVAQEAFLAAWKALPNLRDPTLLRSWIYRVAYHRAITWLRRRGPRGSPFRFLDPEELTTERLDSPDVGPQGADLSPRRRRGDDEAAVTPRLRAALAALPPSYAAAVTLYYFQGLGTSETAQALGVSRSTVKMRLHRARTVLRKTLLDDDDPRAPGGKGPGAPQAPVPVPPVRKRRPVAGARRTP